jgi:hypothetical protein
MPKLTKALKDLRDMTHAVEAAQNAKAPQVGFFSTLDELIQQAPIPDQAKASQWEEYLRPGRALVKEDVTFPLKAEELEYSLVKPLLERLRRENELVNRNQLLSHIREVRPDLGASPRMLVDPRAGEEGLAGRKLFDQQYPNRTRLTNMDLSAVAYEGARPRRPSYHDSRLANTQTMLPGSYEESPTNMTGITKRSHFDPETISWSRTTRQPTVDDKALRLVEELQSDLHSVAGEKLRRAPPRAEDRKWWADLHAANPTLSEAPFPLRSSPLTENTARYFDDRLLAQLRESVATDQIDAAVRAESGDEGWVRRADERARLLGMLDSLPSVRRGYAKDINRQVYEFARVNGIDNIDEAYTRFQRENPGQYSDLHDTRVESDAAARGAVPDAPFKDPADYSLLELKKQLLNAANAGDDYLAVTPAEMQIHRYQGGMEGQREAGMRHVYDRVVPGQLEKLARQYGLSTEDTMVNLESRVDMRPRTLVDNGYETVDELFGEMDPSFNDPGTRQHANGLRRFSELLDELDTRLGVEGSQPNEVGQEIYQAYRTAKEFADEASVADEEQLARMLGGDTGEELSEAMSTLIDAYEESGRQHSEDIATQLKALRLTPELREKIKRIGVPLWTLPAAGVGLEAAMGEGEEPKPGFAGGGSVSKGLRQVVKDIANENPYAGRRAERIMDEEPRLDTVLSPRGLERLAMDPAPVLMMRPDIRPDKASEYRRLALPLVYEELDKMPIDDFMHSADLLEKFRDEGMRVPPLLMGDINESGEKLIMKSHDGRHRAFGLGEIMGMKVPTQFDGVRDYTLPFDDQKKYVRGLGTQTLNDIYNEARPSVRQMPPLPLLRDKTLELLEELLGKLNKVKSAKQEQSGYTTQPDRETSLRNKKGDRFFAGGGLVKTVRDIAKLDPVAGRRAERVLDEAPELANLLQPTALEELAENPAAIALLSPDEYRGIAMPFLGFNSEYDLASISKLRKAIAAEGLIDPPMLELEPRGKTKLRAVTHDGRHRAAALGRLNSRVPTQIVTPDGDTTTSAMQRNVWGEELADAESDEDYELLRQLEKNGPEMPTLMNTPALGSDGKYNVIDSTFHERLLQLLDELNSRDTVIAEPLLFRNRKRPDVKIGKDRFFAAGGVVKKRAKKIGEKARELGMLKQHADGRARIASAALSNFYGVTPEGELTDETLPSFSMEDGVSWPNRPGLVEGTLGLAELLLPEAITPDVVRGSGERYEQTLGQIQDAMGVAPAQSYPEHLQEALGNMLTQVPVPARQGAQGVRGLVSGVAEFVTPTVNPSARNYVGGTLAGGTLTRALQELAEKLPGMREGARGIDPRAPNLEWDPGR